MKPTKQVMRSTRPAPASPHRKFAAPAPMNGRGSRHEGPGPGPARRHNPRPGA